jgi:cobalt transporter subunit CbtB
LAAAALGGVILWAVGFSPAGIAHNAAHDTRHTMAFPCH